MGAPKLSNDDDFPVVEHGEVAIIVFPSVLEKRHEEVLETTTQRLMSSPDIKLYAFNLKGVLELPPFSTRILVKMGHEVRKSGREMTCINVSSTLKNEIGSQGLSKVLNVKKTLNEAKESTGIIVKKTGSTSIDTEFIAPFVEGTKKTLETQVGTGLTSEKPFIKNDVSKPLFDIAGVVNIACPQFTGAIAVCFPEKTFLSIYEKMLGESHNAINDEVKDAAGELMNIIFGVAKTELKAKGYQLESVIPTIMSGKGLEVTIKGDGPTVILPFKTDLGSFHIEIVLDKTGA